MGDILALAVIVVLVICNVIYLVRAIRDEREDKAFFNRRYDG